MSKVRAADMTPSPTGRVRQSAACIVAPSSRRLMPISLGPIVGMNQTSAGRSDEVGHGIGDGDVVDQRGLLRVRKRQALDRLAGRADHRRFREGAGQKPGGRPDVVAEKLREPERREQTRHAQDDRERHLGNRVALQPAKELRPHLVPGREEEQVEEDRLDERRDLDVELPDQDAGQTGSRRRFRG